MSDRFHRSEFHLLPARAFRRALGRNAPATLEGGGGSSAPPPDPRLVDAQIRSMGIQDQAIQDILAQSREMLPVQKEQMQFGLDTAKTAYDQSQEDRAYALDRRSALTGLQDQVIADAKGFNTAERTAELTGQAGADVNAAFSAARDQSARDMARRGITPGSGKALAMGNSMEMAQAAATAGATSKAREAARTEGYALTDRATNVLAGYPAMGMATTGQGAGYGTTGLTVANQGAAGANAGFQSAAQIAGSMGTNATGMYSVQQQAKTAADSQSGSMFGSILGAGATLGAAYLGRPSDRRLKTNIVAVGGDERTGLTLYEFDYIDGTPGRWRGVMADEVARARPDAVVMWPNGFMVVRYDLLGIELQLLEA